MIGMVLVTHGHLATEFLAALEHVVGPQRNVEAIDIGPEDDVEQRRRDIIDAVARVTVNSLKSPFLKTLPDKFADVHNCSPSRREARC